MVLRRARYTSVDMSVGVWTFECLIKRRMNSNSVTGASVGDGGGDGYAEERTLISEPVTSTRYCTISELTLFFWKWRRASLSDILQLWTEEREEELEEGLFVYENKNLCESVKGCAFCFGGYAADALRVSKARCRTGGPRTVSETRWCG